MRAVATRRGERGIALVMVLILGALLTTVVAALARRSIVDSYIAHNRDAVAQAEALARGGIRVATALIIAERLTESADSGARGNTHLDLWAQAGNFSIQTPDGGTLRFEIFDEGARLNLNALVDWGDPNATVSDEAVEFVVDFLKKVIEEMPIPPGDKIWDPRELSQNLLDYIDRDDVRLRGGAEDDYYQSQDPPYSAPNSPLLTVDEIQMIEGFDATLLEALRPYVTVHPMAGGAGINLNTAPSHVLAAVYHGNQGSRRLASEDTVRRILRARQDGQILCNEAAADDRCILVSEIVDGSIFPPSQAPSRSAIFRVVAEATVGEIQRSIEAVIDSTELANPQVLVWRSR